MAEAAMLAGLFKAPTKYAPHVNLPAARARANDVLTNMVDAGFITEGQVYAARRNPATPVDRKPRDQPDYYLDWAFADLKHARGRWQARRRPRPRREDGARCRDPEAGRGRRGDDAARSMAPATTPTRPPPS